MGDHGQVVGLRALSHPRYTGRGVIIIFKSCLPASIAIFPNKSRKLRCKHKEEKYKLQK